MTQVEIAHRATTQDGFQDTDEPIYSDEGNPDHSINVTPGLPVTVEAPTWGLYRGLPARIENHNWRNLSNTTRVTFTPDESTSVHTINYDVVNSAHRGLIGKVEDKPDIQLYRNPEATSPAEDVEELEFSEPSSHSLPSTVYDRDGRIYDAIGETTYSRDTPNYYLGQRDDIHVVHYRERVQTLKPTDSPKRELEPNAVVTRYQYEDGRDIEAPTVSDTFGGIKDFEGTRLVYDVVSPENDVQVKTYYYTATTTSKSVETPPSVSLPAKVVTRYINEDMEEISESQVGDTAGDNFDIRGYYFDRTQRDPEDLNIITHVYHPLYTPTPDPQFPEHTAPDESRDHVAPQMPSNGSTEMPEATTPGNGSTETVPPANSSTENVGSQTPSTGSSETAPQTPGHSSSENVPPRAGSTENVAPQTPSTGSSENVPPSTDSTETPQATIPSTGSTETVPQTPGHGSTETTPSTGSTETPQVTAPSTGSTETAPSTGSIETAPSTGSSENVAPQTPGHGSSENVAPQTPSTGPTETVAPQTPSTGSTEPAPSTGSTETTTPGNGSTETAPQTPSNGPTERPETVTPTNPQPETPLGGNPSETPDTSTPSRPEPETPLGHPGFDVRVSIKGPALVQEDLPELVVTEKGESTTQEDLPELVVTEKVESTKADELPELVVTEKGEGTTQEDLPELFITEKGEGTTQEDLPQLVVAEKGEGTTQEDLPQLVVTDKGEGTTQEDLPELVVTEKGTTQEDLPQLVVTDKGEGTTQEDLPQLVVTGKGEGTTQETLPELVVTEKGESTKAQTLPELVVTEKGEIFTLYHTEGPQGQPVAYGRVEALVQPDLDPLTFNNPSDMVNEPLVCAKGQPAVQEVLPELIVPDTEQPTSQKPSDEPRSEQPTVSNVEQGSDQPATTNEKPYAKPTVLSGASPLPHTGEAGFNLLPLSLAFLGLGIYFLRKP